MAAVKAGSTGGRVASLDALRGFDMFWIIGGDTIVRRLPALSDAPWTRLLAGQVEHNAWGGVHVLRPDLPAVPLRHRRRFPVLSSGTGERGKARTSRVPAYRRRSLILILLGLIAGGVLRFDFANMRWMGVLQRIGVCYFLVSILVLYTKVRTQFGVFFAVLLLYSAALALVPVPGHGAGVMTPEGSLHSYVDQRVMPGGSPRNSTGPVTAWGCSPRFLRRVLFCWGIRRHLAEVEKKRQDEDARAAWRGSLFGRRILVEVALSDHQAYLDELVRAVGGRVVSPSLGAFYWLIDVKGTSRWAFFFIVIGTNAILSILARKS